LKIIERGEPRLARPAAEAVGRIGDARAVPTLLHAIDRLGAFKPDAAGAPDDAALRILEHGFIYALIEIGDAQETAKGLDWDKLSVTRAVLVALDQMDGNHLTPKQVLNWVSTDFPMLNNTARWVVGHRPEWGEQLVDHFRACLAQPQLYIEPHHGYASELAQLAKSPAIQDFLATLLRDAKAPSVRGVALRAMAEARLNATPAAWLDELAKQLPRLEGAELATAVATARALRQPKGGHAELRTALNDVGRRSGLARETRLAALTTAGETGPIETDLLKELMLCIQPDGRSTCVAPQPAFSPTRR
jgi:hypothetical protein